ncbi:phage tail protein [Streptomyces sp. NPDC050263]|uniref:phage tail protein n=1 Tax=Streptomyces sp. NPDC050263 TaxID=3155037 RepID=UPI0034197E48
MSTTQDPAVTVCFVVTIDGIELGSFNSCEGLGCEVVLEAREEGGNNGHVWQLPTRLKYPNVKLSRPLTKDTQKVAKWFASMTTGFARKTAHIEARTGDDIMVARWGLLEVVPVRWTGPTFNPESPKVATETIEIAHHGFTTEPGA